MEIIVSHLTRMKPGFVCVAGLDRRGRAHVRPVLSSGRLPRAIIRPAGGPVDVGVRLDLGPIKAVGKPPEVEDVMFELQNLKSLSQIRPKKFWKLLEKTSKPNLPKIFGKDLTFVGKTAIVGIGKGEGSLGNLKTKLPLEIYVDGFDKIRARVVDEERELVLPVTDLRLYEDNQKTPRLGLIDDIVKRISGGVETILSVGLSRPFSPSGDSEAVHWLQVNNLHLKDRPTGWT